MDAEQLKQDIRDDLFDDDLKERVDRWWSYYSSLHSDLMLINAWTTWKMLDLSVRKSSADVDVVTGRDSVKGSQLYTQLVKSRDSAWEELLRLDDNLREKPNKVQSSTMTRTPDFNPNPPAVYPNRSKAPIFYIY